MLKRHAQKLRALAPLILVALAVISVVATQRLGVHTPAGVGIRAGARNAALWYYAVARQGGALRSTSAINKYWERNQQDGDLTAGQPPLARIIFSVVHLLSSRHAETLLQWVLALLFGAVVWIVFRLGAEWFGHWHGVLAAALFLVFPGTLYYGRSVGPEAVTLFSASFLLFAYCRSQESRWWALLTPLPFAMFCLSAMEGIVLFVPLAIATFLMRRPASSAAGDTGRLAVPGVLFTPLWMFGVGVVIVVTAWPTLWPDPKLLLFQRIVATFKSMHPPLQLFGEVPVSGSGLPFLTTSRLLLTKMPILFGVCAGIGLISLLRVAARGPQSLTIPRPAVVVPLVLACWWVIHSLNGSPYYAGQDLFVLYSPLLVLCAVAGMRQITRRLVLWPRFPLHKPRAQRVTSAALAVLLLGSLLLAQAGSFPYETGYANLIGSGLHAVNPSSAVFPLATLPYRVVDTLNKRCPSSLAVEPSSEALRNLLRRLRQRGFVVASIAPNTAQAKCVLVVYHQGGIEPRPPATWPAVARFAVWGTPLFTVHKAPQ